MHWDTLLSDFESELKFHLRTVPRAERKQILDYIIDRVAELDLYLGELDEEERVRRVRKAPPKPASKG